MSSWECYDSFGVCTENNTSRRRLNICPGGSKWSWVWTLCFTFSFRHSFGNIEVRILQDRCMTVICADAYVMHSKVMHRIESLAISDSVQCTEGAVHTYYSPLGGCTCISTPSVFYGRVYCCFRRLWKQLLITEQIGSDLSGSFFWTCQQFSEFTWSEHWKRVAAPRVCCLQVWGWAQIRTAGSAECFALHWSVIWVVNAAEHATGTYSVCTCSVSHFHL